MKKIILLIVPILLLCGCENDNDKELKIDNVNDSCFQTMCDSKYGIEYIIDTCLYNGGITVRLDENGNVIHCKKDSDKE